MKKIDNCTNLYNISKTLRFRAIPQGKTQENIVKKRIIEEDEVRAKEYKNVKKYMDQYHMFFIDDVLGKTRLEGIEEYADIFFKTVKDDNDKKNMEMMEEKFRKSISEAFKKDGRYKKLFGKEMVTEILPTFIIDDTERNEILDFAMFTTAFTGFYNNRENMYVSDAKSTAISYRCINENLPKFLTNVKAFKKVKEKLGEEILDQIDSEIDMEPYYVKDCFCVDFFDMVLTQEGIDAYNTFLGGKTLENGTKVQGLNEYINLYNQKLSKEERGERIPQMLPLFKQILSDRNSMSFNPEGYEDDGSVLEAINASYTGGELDLPTAIANLTSLISNLEEYNLAGVYVKNGLAITELSNKVTGSWSGIREAWNTEYDNSHKKPTRNLEKYEEKRAKEYKAIEALSIEGIDRLLDSSGKIKDYYKEAVKERGDKVSSTFEAIREIVNGTHHLSDNLVSDEKTVGLFKDYLDAVKEFEGLIKPLMVSDKVDDKDFVFYGILTPLYERIAEIDTVYNQVRNYVTRKPYSKEKYKLYFENPQLMNGWDKNKETDYRSTLLMKDGKYYLAIIDKTDSKVLTREKYEEGDYYDWLNYKLLPSPNKNLPRICFAKSNMDLFCPSPEILEIYKKESFKKGTNFNLNDCRKFIDFYKDCIKKYSWGKDFDFHFKQTGQYNGIDEFFREVESQGYGVKFDKISVEYVNKLVDEGKLYLFQIYNKDFSEYSHGKENLHTMYFKMLFDERNLRNPVIQLCGGAELFLREASLKKEKIVVHPKNKSLANKNPNNPKKESVFAYDIYKDKRYSEDQYMFHVPVKINRKIAGDVVPKYNDFVRKLLKNCDDNYVIGIDRGERNLLYVCVVNYSGEIVEQFSLNEIINEYNGIQTKVDYHTLLDEKERERLAARQNWTTINNIKELKEGYISQVVHKICQLVVKYDAVIAMEDLNSGFKNSRVKVEKQVYQKFEKMLIDKLNYMVDKHSDPLAIGGILKGYQLTNKFTSFREMGRQNGFIFYIPAWLTSKIDPSTGFSDLLKPKYISIEESRKLINNFDAIFFDKEADTFVFKLDYTKFPRTDADYKKTWDLYMNGERIYTFRNSEKNSEWDNRVVDLKAEMKSLMDKHEIAYLNGEDLRGALCKIEDASFYKDLILNIRLMLQMRNSITGTTDVDYLISPVKNEVGKFYDSRDYEKLADSKLPQNADANGAYNIARKVLWAIDQFKDTEEENLGKAKVSISNAEWLEYAQTHTI